MGKHTATLCLALAAVGCGASGSPTSPSDDGGPSGVESVQLVASDGDLRHRFGRSVAIVGDRILIGAVGDGGAGPGSGSAYVFVREGASWIQEAKLVPDDGEPDKEFGISVSMDGDRAVVGAWGDDHSGALSGSVYVFARTGSGWVQEAKLVASDGSEGDGFGRSVSLDGNLLLVGAPLDDDGGPDTGSAYVFVRDGATWSQEAKLTPGSGLAGARFGRAVVLGDLRAMVGAPRRDGRQADIGSVHVFARTASGWAAESQFGAGEPTEGARFGSALSLQGDQLLVGAPSSATQGAPGSAFVFVRTAPGWIQTATLAPGEPAAGGGFGESVALAGERAVVGAPFDQGGGSGSGSGSVNVYVRQGSSWNQASRVVAPGGRPGDEFGRSVAADGTRSVAGAWLQDVGGTEELGAAYVFEE